jgi:hypothetical protein
MIDSSKQFGFDKCPVKDYLEHIFMEYNLILEYVIRVLNVACRVNINKVLKKYPLWLIF